MKNSSLSGWLSCGLLLPLSAAACLFAAAVGGASFGVAPELNLRMVQGLACPAGGKLISHLGAEETFQTFPDETSPAGSETSGRSFTVRCVNDQGDTLAKGDGLLLRTLALILGSYFLACLLPLWLGSTAVLLMIRRRVPPTSDHPNAGTGS
jgi:hypothetical protein